MAWDEFYRSVSVLLLLLFFMVSKKYNHFLNYFLVTQMADQSQTSTGLSVDVYGGLH